MDNQRPSLILASASPARLRTLRDAGLRARGRRVRRGRGREAASGVCRARPPAWPNCKAEAVDARIDHGVGRRVIIGCDSLLELDGAGYGKPARAAEAAAALAPDERPLRRAAHRSPRDPRSDTTVATRTAVGVDRCALRRAHRDGDRRVRGHRGAARTSPAPSPSTAWAVRSSPGSRVIITTWSASACRCSAPCWPSSASRGPACGVFDALAKLAPRGSRLRARLLRRRSQTIERLCSSSSAQRGRDLDCSITRVARLLKGC